MSRNNFIFVEHENIGFDDLWVDGIHLLNSGKTMLVSNFVSEVNRYFGESDNFLGNFNDINLDISFINELKHKGVNNRVDTPISELTVFHKSAAENDINDVKKGCKEIKIHSPDKLILAHLNINSVRNKFEALTYIIDNNIDF